MQTGNGREDAREYFKSEGLKYSDITHKDFLFLQYALADELEKYSKEVNDPEIHGIATMRISYEKRLYFPKFNTNSKKEMTSAFIRVDSHYFEGREAISFNRDGFIGFAGWADDTNVKPFVRAFNKFVWHMAYSKGGNDAKV